MSQDEREQILKMVSEERLPSRGAEAHAGLDSLC
jgi:hypothetical protein